jgi:hypothetical protein
MSQICYRRVMENAPEQTEPSQIAITFRAAPQWLRDLDEWRKRQPATPNRSEVIRTAVLNLIGENKNVRTERTAEE